MKSTLAILDKFIAPLGWNERVRAAETAAPRPPSEQEIEAFRTGLAVGLKENDRWLTVAIAGYFTQFAAFGLASLITRDQTLMYGFFGVEGVGTGALGAYLATLWRERNLMTFLAMSVPLLPPEELGRFVASIRDRLARNPKR